MPWALEHNHLCWSTVRRVLAQFCPETTTRKTNKFLVTSEELAGARDFSQQISHMWPWCRGRQESLMASGKAISCQLAMVSEIHRKNIQFMDLVKQYNHLNMEVLHLSRTIYHFIIFLLYSHLIQIFYPSYCHSTNNIHFCYAHHDNVIFWLVLKRKALHPATSACQISASFPCCHLTIIRFS